MADNNKDKENIEQGQGGGANTSTGTGSNTGTGTGAIHDIIQEVQEYTGCDEEQAKQLLHQAEWDAIMAINKFFESREGAAAAPPPAPLARTSRPDEVQYVSDSSSDSPTAPKREPLDRAAKKKQPAPRFATLQSLQNECSSSDEEEGQAFYAGGSERSGQQILGPGKNKKDIVAEMFKSVKQHGASILNPEVAGSSSSSSFRGTGYQLGSTNDDTVIVGNKSEDKPKSKEQQSVVLRLWKNGFSINGGELRHYNDPANEEFLSYIRRGEIPPELRKGPEVYLTMEDLRHEEFSKSSQPSQPFQGKGYTLGSPTPTTIGSTATSVSVNDKEANLKTAQDSLALNESEPVTNIQIRLADGSRLVGRFNHTHTIAHLRQFITLAAPMYQIQEFILQTTFPNRELTDMSQTIKDAGVCNAQVVQRLK